MLVVAPALAALALLGGCAEGDPGADGDVESLGDLVPEPVAQELLESGRCADGVLWAADDRGALAVTVSIPPDGPSAVVLPSGEVVVEVLHDQDPCAPHDPGASAVEGRLEVDRDDQGCVTAFRLDGLEADDDTALPPVEVSPPPCP